MSDAEEEAQHFLGTERSAGCRAGIAVAAQVSSGGLLVGSACICAPVRTAQHLEPFYKLDFSHIAAAALGIICAASEGLDAMLCMQHNYEVSYLQCGMVNHGVHQ